MAKSVKALITPEVLKWARERLYQIRARLRGEKTKNRPRTP